MEGATAVRNSWLDIYLEKLPYKWFGFAAPTLQMAMKWLRVNYGIHIGILVTYQHIPRKYEVHIMKIEEINDIVLCPIKDFDTYEEACEAAIKYCLTELFN